MKKYLRVAELFALLMICSSQQLFAQAPSALLRGYWDNDFFNIRGKGTDEAYSNGLRFDLFKESTRPSPFFADRLFPKAGADRIDARGWGLMQLMVTPRDMNKTNFQPDDYPYAGALMGIRSYYSYNPLKKYSFQTEFMFGVRGPASFAEQTQQFIHRIINNSPPMGWKNQLDTRIILNLNLTAEKQLAHYRNTVELIGGAQAYAGTLFNSLSAYSTLRIGRMSPYFNGYLSQHASANPAGSKRKKLQAYILIRPAAGIVLSNELLTGDDEAQDAQRTALGVQHWELTVDYGAVVAYNRLSISFTQKTMTAMLKGQPYHEVGNISLYYSW